MVDKSKALNLLQVPPIPREFYDRDPREVARDLLGCLLCRRIGDEILVGRITETEAYLANDDSANHAYRGMTRRNKSMFGPPGHAYVYAIHTHYCLNIVTEPEGVPSAVLIRALEPLQGIDRMRQNRGVENPRLLTTGPGRLCAALQIDLALDGADVTVPEALWVLPGDRAPDQEVVVTSRIGVTSAKELPLRFVLSGTPFVSRPIPRRSPPADRHRTRQKTVA